MPSDLTIEGAIELFLQHRRDRNLSPGTLRLYTTCLSAWCKWCVTHQAAGTIASVTVEHFRGYLGALLASGAAPNSVDSHRRILRAFWHFLAAEDFLSEIQRGYWANGRIPRPVMPDAEPRPYCEADTMAALLSACGDGATEESARNRAIVQLLYESGMRVGELCSLTDEAADHAQRRAPIMGKGRKRGWVFWGPGAAAAMLRYLALRRGKRGGPLFRGVSSRNQGGPLTPNAVRLMIKRLGVAVPKGAPVHFIRHGYAHRALDAGLEVSQVQQLMRHANVETTLRYLKERPEKLQELHRRALGLVRRTMMRGTGNE